LRDIISNKLIYRVKHMRRGAMKTRMKWAVLLCVFPAVIIACGGGGGGGGSVAVSGGTLQVNLTDNPGDYLSVLVTIVGIEVIVEGSGPVPLDFADFDSPAIVKVTPDSVTVDLIQLSNEEPIEFAFVDLPPGEVNQIRLIISESSLIAYEDVVGIDGPDPGEDITHVRAEFLVKVPSGPQTGVKLNPRDVEIRTGWVTTITLDFDAEKSIVQLGGAGHAHREYHFILKPVIFILEATGLIPVDTRTLAFGLNFPTGLQVAMDVGGGSLIRNGDVLVANAGTAGVNSNTVLNIDVLGDIPVDATTLVPFVSSSDVVEVEPGLFEPLVNRPSGVAQYEYLVWISNPVSVVGGAQAGTVSEVETGRIFSNLFIGNEPPTESVFGLRMTSGIEFAGFAPNGSLSGSDLFVVQTNGNGSVTGIYTKKEGRIVDVLGAGVLSEPSDAAFIPEPFNIGDGPGTLIGTLYVTDAAENVVEKVSLTTTGTVGDPATRISALIVDTFPFAYASEPVGIAYSAGSDSLYIGNRGNGTIIAAQTDGAEIATYDTGLGGDAINGVDVIFNGTADLVLLTNTAGNDDPSNDAPGIGMSTLEAVVISLP
jgi:hypothetical protein